MYKPIVCYFQGFNFYALIISLHSILFIVLWFHILRIDKIVMIICLLPTVSVLFFFILEIPLVDHSNVHYP